ncbi:hypothetical protein TWF281_004410 [Arthrobotrys megalospora]
MRSTLFYIGIQCLLAGLSLATDVKDCPKLPDKTTAENGLGTTCFGKLGEDFATPTGQGYNICKAICDVSKEGKSFKPGENSDEEFSVELYVKLLNACGTHGAIVKALEDKCGCYAEGIFFQDKCKIKLNKPDGSTGSVTSTSNPADTTKDYQPAQTSSSTTEVNEAPEPETTKHETTTDMKETSTSTEDVETPTATNTMYDDVESSSEEPTMSSTRGYDEEVSTPTTMSSTRGYDEEVTTSTTMMQAKETTTTKSSTTMSKNDRYPEETPSEDTESSMPSTTETTSMKTSMPYKDVEETSSTHSKTTATPYGQVEETSTEGPEYTTPSHTKVASTSQETTTASSTTKASTTKPSYDDEDVETSKESTTMPTKVYDTMSTEESTTDMPTQYTTTPATYDRAEVSTTLEEELTSMKYTTTSHSSSISTTPIKEETTTESKTVTTPRYYDSESTQEPVMSTESSLDQYSSYYNPSSTASTKLPEVYTTIEESTKTPVAYTTPEESTESTKPPMSYTAEATKTTKAYQAVDETTTSMEHKTTHPSTTTADVPGYSASKPASVTWTMNACPTPTNTMYAEPDTVVMNVECFRYLEAQTIDTVCARACNSKNGSWGKLDADELQAYTEAYEVCAEEKYELRLALKNGCACFSEDFAGCPIPTDKPNNYIPSTSTGAATTTSHPPRTNETPHAYTTPPPSVSTPMAYTTPPPSASTPMACTNANKEWPDNCLSHVMGNLTEHQMIEKQQICGFLCNKESEDTYKYTDKENLERYNKLSEGCGGHKFLIDALVEGCGCIMKDYFEQGKTCVYPRKPLQTAPSGYNTPAAYTTAKETAMPTPSSYTHVSATRAYVSSAETQTPMPTYPVEECPKDYEGKRKWPEGNCLDEAFGTDEGVKIAEVVCNLQCADFQQTQWPVDYTETYHKARGKCKTPSEMNRALAKGCGCLNYGWVKTCRPQCEPPAGYTSTSMVMPTTMAPKPTETTTPPPKDTSMATSWTTTTYVTAPCQGCAVTTITTTVPCPPSKTSTMETTSMETSMETTGMATSWTMTTYVTAPCQSCAVTTITTTVPCPPSKTSITAMVTTTSESMTAKVSYRTTTYTDAICEICITKPWTYTEAITIQESTTESITETPPTTTMMTTEMPPTPTSWSTVTYMTAACGGCPVVTLTTTLPCPTTLNTVKIAPENANTCTTRNDIPQCTVPPGKLEGPSYSSRCNQWYLIKEGDTCEGLSKSIPLDMTLIKAWNGLDASANCTCTPGRWICVGLIDGNKKPDSVRYAKGRPTYSDYGPEATAYDNAPKQTPEAYVPGPTPPPQNTPGPVAYR